MTPSPKATQAAEACLPCEGYAQPGQGEMTTEADRCGGPEGALCVSCYLRPTVALAIDKAMGEVREELENISWVDVLIGVARAEDFAHRMSFQRYVQFASGIRAAIQPPAPEGDDE